MSNKIKNNHIGETVGVFEIVELMPYKDTDGHALYRGICNECGFERIARYADLKSTLECTHIRVDGELVVNIAHWSNQKLRIIFGGMKDRCYNPSCKDFRWYGEKGIKICKEWMDNPKLFENWSLSNGYQDGLTIDRINSDKDYSPDNCRWISLERNARYKSTTSLICVNDTIRSGKEWSKILNLGINTINRYVREYGVDNTIEFIKKRLENPNIQIKHGESYYTLYMLNKNVI